MPVTSTGSSLGGNGTTARWAKLRKRILERDGYVCAYCHGRANSVDHVVPRAAWPDDMPGVDDPGNLVACCKPCNSKKGSKMGPPPREKNIQRFTSREW